MTHDRKLKIVGWAHFLGGILGLFPLVAPGVFGPRQPAYWYVTLGVLYTLSVVSGLAVLRRWPAARPLATVVEGFQLLAFHTGRFGFLFYSGLQTIFLITPTRMNLRFGFQSEFGVGPAMRVAEPFVAIDLMTLAMWWLIWRARAPETAFAAAEPTTPGAPDPAV